MKPRGPEEVVKSAPECKVTIQRLCIEDILNIVQFGFFPAVGLHQCV